jgi:DNA polymerase I
MGAQLGGAKLNITEAEASSLINRFFQTYPGVKRWIEGTRADARRHGFVRTIVGRHRTIPHIASSNSGLKAQAERQAANTVIQGSASDLMKVPL